MSSSYLMNLLASAVAVIVGIVIHENAHAAAAWALGDKTARSRGRVSLNPLNHIDPFGTIILPLLMLAAAALGARMQAESRMPPAARCSPSPNPCPCTSTTSSTPSVTRSW